MESVEVAAYTVPTDGPESDGTLEWSETTVCTVHVRAGGEEGLGYAYTAAAAAALVRDVLAPVLEGMDAMSPPAAWEALRQQVRNVGRPGIASSALSAVDAAMWDLKARLLGLPLVTLLGQIHDGIPAYGSGGFTSYPLERLRGQLAGWAEEGLRMVKMKVGREPDDDPERVAAAREAVGEDVQLFVDANGAYSRKEALYWTWAFAEEWGVSWMEEPVSSNDLDGLRLLRDQGPPGCDIAAGEYGWSLPDFRELLVRGAVDTLQVDVTRCGGITPLLRVAALCDAHETPLSGHTAPALHAPALCAVPRAVHVEWFHDHARIESMLFDGAPTPRGGVLHPNTDGPGHGLTLKRQDAEPYRTGAGR
ncbi:MAG: mandelate racemase [Gemmatimonadetes bacterium]|nr:mandelate racemase [Gemmatimonadota bacterium]